MAKETILTLLRRDHEYLADLFERIEEADDERSIRQLYLKIRHELRLHAHGEIQVVYPELRNSEATHELCEIYERDHDLIETLLGEMDNLSSLDSAWNDSLLNLIETVRDHVTEEEDEMFEELRRSVSMEQQELLARRFVEAKEEVKSKAA